MSIMFFFSLSNGYISTLLMLSAIVDPSLDVTEIPIAATLLAFYLTGGLAMGSTVSFPVRAYICQCNPFLN
jgi:equilibrative nucleoside transporter 1/2/3